MNGWNQNKLYKRLRTKKIKNWFLVVSFLFCLLITIGFLRHNNLKMVELRNQVILADEQNKDVGMALEKLNYQVFHHINTKIVRPVELVYSYNRAAKASIEAANRGSGRDIYLEATTACERRGVPIPSIAQCAADYALANNPGIDPSKVNLPDKNLFKYSFTSPIWVPDAAGIFIVITGVIGLWIFSRIVQYSVVALVIRYRLKNDLI